MALTDPEIMTAMRVQQDVANGVAGASMSVLLTDSLGRPTSIDFRSDNVSATKRLRIEMTYYEQTAGPSCGKRKTVEQYWEAR